MHSTFKLREIFARSHVHDSGILPGSRDSSRDSGLSKMAPTLLYAAVSPELRANVRSFERESCRKRETNFRSNFRSLWTAGQPGAR